MNRSPQLSGGLSATRSTSASAIVFAFFLAVGAAYIIASKSLGMSTLWATLVPLLIISTYAALLGFARYLRLRDDQAGDNLYYLGFLYTLTSLGVSLWQFSTSGGAEAVVTNFGVAVSSTILGVALRVIFGQMRQDPLEVERSARLELAEAARRVRQELDATVFELSSFRRATQQSLLEGMVEVKNQIELVSATIVEALKDLPERLASGLEQNVSKLDKETSQLVSTAEEVTEALKKVETQLKAMQMPDGIIEIKLQPTIRSMTKALKDLSEKLGSQVDELQTAVHAMTTATTEAGRSSEAALAAQNLNSERIVTLLSSTQELLRRLSDGTLAGQDRQRERDGILASPPERQMGAQRMPTDDAERRPHTAPAVQPANVSSGRWLPWSRR